MTSVTSDRRQGLNSSAAIKVPCRAATTGNIVLNGLQTIDGVVLATGDRVLVKDQTNTIENGIYDVDTGNWTRSLDFDGAYDTLEGTIVTVLHGNTYTHTLWMVSTVSPSVGSALAFTVSQLSPTDSNNVTFLQAGTGAVARTSQAKMRDIVCVLDFMDAADVALVISNTAAGQNATSVTAAHTAALAAASAVYAPAGTYVTNSKVTIPAFKGLYGDGYGTFYAPSVGNNGTVFELGGDITTLSTRPFLKGVRITPDSANTGVTGVKRTCCQMATIADVDVNSYPSKSTVGFAADGGNLSGFFNLLSNCNTSACHIGFDHFSTGTSYSTQDVYIDCNATGTYPTDATCRGMRFYRGGTGLPVCGANSSIFGGNMEAQFVGLDISGADDPNTAGSAIPAGINFNGTRFESNKYNIDQGTTATRNTFAAINGYETFVAGGASYRTAEPRSLQNVGMNIEAPANTINHIGSGNSVYNQYYGNTASLRGSVGNGAGLVSAGAVGDFGIRSEVDLIFCSNGGTVGARLFASGTLALLTSTSQMNGGAAAGSFILANDDASTYLQNLGHSHASAGNIVLVGGNFIPGANGTKDLGSTALRWNNAWVTAGAFNASDANLKTEIAPLTPAEIEAAKQMAKEVGTFQFLESVKAKGSDAARHHVGMTVQRAAEILKANGLDPWRYGFMAYDKWPDKIQEHEEIIAREAKPAVLDGEGNVIQMPEPAIEGKPAWKELILAAGEAYSFRSDQLNLFIARGFEARLAALEAKA